VREYGELGGDGLGERDRFVALNFIVNFGVDSGESFLVCARVVHACAKKEKGRAD
jgi:hypothetical protein